MRKIQNIPKFIEWEIVTASSDMEELSFSTLRIKGHSRGIHTEIVGTR